MIIADTAWYSRDESGQRMLAERRKAFTERYGFPSDGVDSLEYLTDRRLGDAGEDSFAFAGSIIPRFTDSAGQCARWKRS